MNNTELMMNSTEIATNGTEIATNITKYTAQEYMDNIYEPIYTEEQMMLLAWASFVPSLLSLLGSSSNYYFILFSERSLPKLDVYNRLVLGMTTCDAVTSIGLLIMNPWGVPTYASRMSHGAMGDRITCDVAGYFLQLIMCSLLYSAFLAMYFANKVVCGGEGRCLEPFAHTISILWPNGVAAYSIYNELHNPLDYLAGWCGIQIYPPDCDDIPEVDCLRGNNYSSIYHDLVTSGAIVFSFLCIIICMSLIIWKVSRIDRQIRHTYQLAEPSSSSNVVRRQNMSFTKEFGKIALMYIAAFFLTFIWFVIFDNLKFPRDIKYSQANFAIAFAVKFFSPLQGFFNALIYFKHWKTNNFDTRARSD